MEAAAVATIVVVGLGTSPPVPLLGLAIIIALIVVVAGMGVIIEGTTGIVNITGAAMLSICCSIASFDG